jgi:hypothetical protein
MKLGFEFRFPSYYKNRTSAVEEKWAVHHMLKKSQKKKISKKKKKNLPDCSHS